MVVGVIAIQSVTHTHTHTQTHPAAPADSMITQHSSPETTESHPSPVIPDTQSHIGPELATPPSPPTVSQQSEFNPFPAVPDNPDLDAMPYHSYTWYMDGPDANLTSALFSPHGKPTILCNASPLRMWTPPKSRNLPFH